MQSLYQRIYETIGDTEPVGFRLMLCFGEFVVGKRKQITAAKE